MASSRRLPALLLASAVALAGCGSGADGGDTGRNGDPSGSESGAASTAPALTPEDYGARIGDVRGPIRKALSRLAAARTVGSLRTRAEKAEEVLTGAAEKLSALAPPADARAEHDAYVAALRKLATGIGEVRVSIDTGAVCTGSGVLAGLGRSGELDALAEAADALAGRGDYPADVMSVKARKETSRRLPNGRYIVSENRSGRGRFAITNGGDRDAVVTMVRGKKKAVSVYVRRGSKFTVSGVRDGEYDVYFTTGEDWDAKAGAFTRLCSFQRFEE